MNKERAGELLAFYKKHYDEIRVREDHKWKAVLAFRTADPLHAADFPAALRNALKDTGTLLDSGMYFPRTGLFVLLEKDPEAVQIMFEELLRSKADVFRQAEIFSTKAAVLRRKCCTPKELPDDDQDTHAVSVYLTLAHPEENYIYRFTEFVRAAELLEYPFVPRRNDERNFPEYYQFCEALRRELLSDEELLKLEAARDAAFPGADPERHLLVSDLVHCAASYFRRPELLEEKGTLTTAGRFRLRAKEEECRLGAIPFFDLKEMVRYEEQLHAAGLRFLLHEERIRVRGYRISIRKQPEILDAGRARGEGYELLSYDRHGDPICIAVRVTVGRENESFTISEAERVRSAADPEHYRLYRVYGFDPETETGSYSIYKGDLSPFCLNPDSWRVVF